METLLKMKGVTLTIRSTVVVNDFLWQSRTYVHLLSDISGCHLNRMLLEGKFEDLTSGKEDFRSYLFLPH